MGLKVNLTIDELDSGLDVIDKLLNNSIRTATGFVVDEITIRKIPIDDTSAINFDIFTDLGIDKTKLTFIHIVAETKELLPADVKKPLNFDLTFVDGGNTTVMTVSQFQLLEVASFASNITITNIQTATASEKAELQIVIGSKK